MKVELSQLIAVVAAFEAVNQHWIAGQANVPLASWHPLMRAVYDIRSQLDQEIEVTNEQT